MQKVYTLVLLLVGWSIPVVAWATPQTPDLLLYNGDTLLLENSPLEAYFAERGDGPCHSTTCGTSGNWRCFEAVWRLENQQLYLTAIRPDRSCPANARQIYLRRWFRPDARGWVKADWFTGPLVLADGASDVGLIYPRYFWQWHCVVRQGKVQTPPLPVETKLWKNIPVAQRQDLYCQLRSYMTPEEKHYAGIHSQVGAQAWALIDMQAPEPVTILMASTPELAAATLRIMRQYLREHASESMAQPQLWAFPVLFTSDGAVCVD